MLVSTAQIYDAVFDDELFGAVLGTLASSIGARSYCSSWIFADRTSWACDSGHWTSEQVELYMSDFASDDIWSAAQLNLWRPGMAIDVSGLVSDREFERSRLHDQYLRTIGDDMRHCVSIGAENASGIGAVSFHRGTASRGFDDNRVELLDELAPHLARMLALRSRFAAIERRSNNRSILADVLDVPVMLVDPDLRLVEANAAAEALLRSGPFKLDRGRLKLAPALQPVLDSLIAQALDPRHPVAGAIAVPWGDGPSLPFSIVPGPATEGPRHAMLVGSQRRAAVGGKDDIRRLRMIYGLSPGEAQLAVALGSGATLATIAAQRDVAIGTVRFQVKAIARKLDCRGQSDIIRIVGSLPPLRHTD